MTCTMGAWRVALWHDQPPTGCNSPQDRQRSERRNCSSTDNTLRCRLQRIVMYCRWMFVLILAWAGIFANAPWQQ